MRFTMIRVRFASDQRGAVRLCRREKPRIPPGPVLLLRPENDFIAYELAVVEEFGTLSREDVPKTSPRETAICWDGENGK